MHVCFVMGVSEGLFKCFYVHLYSSFLGQVSGIHKYMTACSPTNFRIKCPSNLSYSPYSRVPNNRRGAK